MLNIIKNMREETRFTIILVALLLGSPLLLLILDRYMMKSATNVVKTQQDKTVIIKGGDGPPQPLPKTLPPKSVVEKVRGALEQGNYSTAYMEITKVPKNSPEYQELRNAVAEETKKRKAPTLRREKQQTGGSVIRYLDETTPRTRAADAVFIYFVDIGGTFWPRLCVQSYTTKTFGLSGFQIVADNKTFDFAVAEPKKEKAEKGVSEWHEMPLDEKGYGAVQAALSAKKATLVYKGASGSRTRNMTDDEKKGFRRILDGYGALGGNLSFMGQQPETPRKPAPQDKAKKP